MADLTQAQLDTLLQTWMANDTGADAPDYVVVVDVGQGNLNVVMNALGKPVLYFDMGRGVKGGAYTFPFPATTLCGAAGARYMLSHWDEDHIEFAIQQIENGALANTQWLAPDQFKKRKAREFMSAKAKSLATKLKQNGRNLFLWPDNNTVPSASSTNGVYTVLKINGKNMNESGIALKLRHATNVDQFMLLLGDACFESGTVVHGLADGECVGLVAGHHGAEIHDEDDLPNPRTGMAVAERRTLAYSFGWGNQFGLPNGKGIESYETRGWQDGDRLDTGGGETGAAYAGPRGNVGLLWPLQRGPGKPSVAEINAAATLVGRNVLRNKAVAVLASGCAELQLYGHDATAEMECVIAVAAFEALKEFYPAMGAIFLEDGDEASTLATCATALGAVTVNSLLARSLNTARVHAEKVDFDFTSLAVHLSEAILSGAVAVAKALSNAGAEAARLSLASRINSLARTAALAARAAATAAQTINAVKHEITTYASYTLIWDYADAVDNEVGLSEDEMADALTAAITQGARFVIGNAGDANTRAEAPPTVAADVVAVLGGLAASPSEYLQAAIGAIVACMPAINIDPYAGDPGMPPISDWVKKSAGSAALAAMFGVLAGVDENDAASAAVAAVRVMIPAVNGAPQAGCHRHPKQCGANVCHLSMHYLIPE